ncbi:hypothetical protein ACSTS3_10495 [Aquimarina muelleri]|uniref:hypothetical protein n=1 Tax=Aquimarina muelleri TaxID=279356 RepID=UPI003F682A0B
MKKNNSALLTRKDLLKKLEQEFEESETLQWFIEVEIKRLTRLGSDSSYEELKRISKISEERIDNLKNKKK